MAKQTVNLGTSANKGDGDPLRTAFTKVNANFTEVYGLLGAEGGDVDDVVAPMLVHNSHTNVTVTRDDAANKIIFSVDPYDGDITGSVFADDSTLLVDGVSGKVMLTTNTTTELTEGTNLYYTDVRADARITNAGSANWNTAYGWGDHSVAGYLTSVPAQTFTSLTGKPTTLAGYSITDAATAAQGVLAASALQAETITLATLKTEVAASADFAAFKGRIAAL